MQASATERTQSFYWDRFRDTTMGRYLFEREYVFITRHLREVRPLRRLLDVGSGSGRITLHLRHAASEVVGIDADRIALNAFQRQITHIPVVQGDALRLPYPDDTFDSATAIQSFDYLDHSQFLSELGRVLRTDGLLMFDALNRHSYKGVLKTLANRRLALPSTNFSYREILQATADAGFSIEAVHGYNWVPLTRSSDSQFVSIGARIERALRLDRLPNISPKILIAARKGT